MWVSHGKMSSPCWTINTALIPPALQPAAKTDSVSFTTPLLLKLCQPDLQQSGLVFNSQQLFSSSRFLFLTLFSRKGNLKAVQTHTLLFRTQACHSPGCTTPSADVKLTQTVSTSDTATGHSRKHEEDAFVFIKRDGAWIRKRARCTCIEWCNEGRSANSAELK